MPVPFIQKLRVGAYVLKQKLKGVERYPLVLMLEPLFRCNLACPGCGKIDYADEILNRRLSKGDCLRAVEECGAPVVSIPGGEPLLHKEIAEIVKAITAPTGCFWKKGWISSNPRRTSLFPSIWMGWRPNTTHRWPSPAPFSAPSMPSARPGIRGSGSM